MLSRPGPLPTGPGWSYELKWDVFRAIVSTEDGYRVRSRRGWGATEKLRDSLRLRSAEWMKQLRGSLFAATLLESFKTAREAAANATIADLRAIGLPKIDLPKILAEETTCGRST